MRFSLRTRVLGIPLVLVALSVSSLVAGFFWLLTGMWQAQLHDLSISQEGLANKGFKSLEKQAITIAAMASRVPGVQEAYGLAREEKEEEGRKTLRKGFDRIHKQVTQALGVKDFKIHFHLPPAKSFLRIWRQNGKKDGGDDMLHAANEISGASVSLAEGASEQAAALEETGSKIALKTSDTFGRVSKETEKISNLISEFSHASKEQAQGIDQLNQAVTQIDSVTQQNTANAEESVAASKGLTTLASQLNRVVEDLASLLSGEDNHKQVNT